MDSTDGQFSFNRGPHNLRSPPPLAVSEEDNLPIDVRTFAWFKLPPAAASAEQSISKGSAKYHPVTPQRVTTPKGVPAVGLKSADYPGWRADATPTPVPAVPPISPEDKLPNSEREKKSQGQEAYIFLPTLLESSQRLTCLLPLDNRRFLIWMEIVKTLGRNERLLGLLKHYKDESRDPASKKKIENLLRSRIPGASGIGNLLEETIRILSQELGKDGINKDRQYLVKVKAALKYREKSLASAGAMEGVEDGAHVAAVQSVGPETQPVVLRWARKGASGCEDLCGASGSFHYRAQHCGVHGANCG